MTLYIRCSVYNNPHDYMDEWSQPVMLIFECDAALYQGVITQLVCAALEYVYHLRPRSYVLTPKARDNIIGGSSGIFMPPFSTITYFYNWISWWAGRAPLYLKCGKRVMSNHHLPTYRDAPLHLEDGTTRATLTRHHRHHPHLKNNNSLMTGWKP